MESLPDTWTQYDLIVSAAMLEYVPRGRLAVELELVEPLLALRKRLPPLQKAWAGRNSRGARAAPLVRGVAGMAIAFAI